MYILVAYNLSDIQKGIQASHAVDEYTNHIWKTNLNLLTDKEMAPDLVKLRDWIENYKTMIILNGGTTNNKGTGSLQTHYRALNKLGVDYSIFQEPDLNDAETAVAFLVDMEEDDHIVGYLKQMNLA